jgi:hypothetical protein
MIEDSRTPALSPLLSGTNKPKDFAEFLTPEEKNEILPSRVKKAPR